ncbi:unnamed protein product [Trichobilharzia szidati]|nr:unnamed protein product [Trichobilharzia szidati]CAH8839084.1 unnamed protein product [Trichobilharzia szidati]
MDQMNRLDELPTVDDVLKRNYEEYQNYSIDFLQYKEFCQYGLAESITKVYDWCVHLQCLSPFDPCVPLSDVEFKNRQIELVQVVPTSYNNNSNNISGSDNNTNTYNNPISSLINESMVNTSSLSTYDYMQQIANNITGCYDDFICDKPYNSYPNYCILGVVCFTLCLCGIISNLILLPAYNFGLNRSGATVYLSAMVLFDCLYMIFTLLIYVIHYMPSSFIEQMEMYGQFSGYLIPWGLPILQICELLVVWLTIALLVNRLLYLNFGPHSKALCSQIESVKIITAIFLLCITYMGCKFFEYRYVEYSEKKVVRVLLTDLGKMEMFRDIMDNWLKVPLEMFLPYLACGLLITIIVLKMVNLNTSKWKAVASLCTDTACACVCRAGVCGKECREGVKSSDNPSKSWSSSAADDADAFNIPDEKLHKSVNTTIAKHSPHHHHHLTKGGNNIAYLDPIEQELAYLFFQLPQIDETRENANVITAVCIGLILLICKIPKFLLHVLSTENYITYDPEVFRMINQLLDTMFAACKPVVCILVGAHYRQALTTPPKCCPMPYNNENRQITVPTTAAATLMPVTSPTSGDGLMTTENCNKNNDNNDDEVNEMLLGKQHKVEQPIITKQPETLIKSLNTDENNDDSVSKKKEEGNLL